MDVVLHSRLMGSLRRLSRQQGQGGETVERVLNVGGRIPGGGEEATGGLFERFDEMPERFQTDRIRRL